MSEVEIKRNEVTEPENFVWIPTGHDFGVPTGIVGYWDGSKNFNRWGSEVKVVEFPEGFIKLGDPYVKMYEPTDAEIDACLADDERWAERFAGAGK